MQQVGIHYINQCLLSLGKSCKKRWQYWFDVWHILCIFLGDSLDDILIFAWDLQMSRFIFLCSPWNDVIMVGEMTVVSIMHRLTVYGGHLCKSSSNPSKRWTRILSLCSSVSGGELLHEEDDPMLCFFLLCGNLFFIPHFPLDCSSSHQQLHLEVKKEVASKLQRKLRHVPLTVFIFMHKWTVEII